MKLRSNYLNEDIESYEVSDGSGTNNIVAHSVLEDVINNHPLCRANNVKYTYTVICREVGHYAFLCHMSDVSGRCVETVGEAMDATLKTQIGKEYPVLMAAKRAFDDAAIKFLQLPKAYSDQQISTPAKQNTTAPAKATQENAKQESAKEAKDEPVAPVSLDDPRFAQPLTFGRNLGKSLNDLWPENRADIEWMATKMNPAREETKLLQIAAIDFLKLKEAV